MATGDSALFNGNLVLSSTNGGGVVFGNTGGVSSLANGKTITIGTGGFTNDYLTLKNFIQLGSTSQTLTLTGTAIVNMINCTINGNLTVTAPGFLIKDNTFNGTATLARNGSTTNHQSDGGNTFHGAVTIDNAGSGGRIRLSTSTGDTFYGNATFNCTGGQDVQLCYNGNSYFYGDITINSNKVVFNTSIGKVTFAGSNSQTLNGSYNFPFKKLAINKSANHVIVNSILSVDDTLTFVSGNLITTSSNLLTMKAGSVAIGATNASFVDGPLKKIGNTAFVFPTGKSGIMGTVEMSAPASISNSFTAEYFNVKQTLGDLLSSNVRFLSNQNYWSFQRIDGTSTVAIKLGWDKSLFDFGIDSTSGKIAYWNGMYWNGISSDTSTQIGNKIYLKTTSSISSFGFFTVSNIIYGARFTSYITSTGNVEVFGTSGNAQHGNCSLLISGPSLTYYNTNPALPQVTDEANYCTSPVALNNIIKISHGWEHTLALKCDKTVVAWGKNDENQIGNSNITMNRSLVGVPVESSSNVSLSNIIDIAAGKYNSMAVDGEGYAYYWGYSLLDLIGNPSTNTILPEKLRINSSTLVTNAVAVSAGSDHLVVLLRDGTVLTFGSNTFGQLGVDNTATPNSIYGVQVQTNSGVLSNIIAISAGDRITLALDKSGDVYAWGFNNNGQLGLGAPAFPFYEKYAQKIATLSDIKSIYTQVATSMAIKNNNSVYCWGLNNFYQCGQTSNSPGTYDTPVQVTLPSGISDLSYGYVGERHCVLFTKDNQMVAWGDNLEGQLAVPLATSYGWPNCTYPSSCPTTPIEISNQQNGAQVISDPLIPCDEFKNYCYSKFLISSSTVWASSTNSCTSINSGVTISDEIFIAKGASLTLNSGTYYFGPNGRIILEEGDGTLGGDGAQLIVNSGATLTGNAQCMWKGIEVRGNTDYNASNVRQAKVTVNGGRIEHAHNAATLGTWDNNYYECFETAPSTFLSGFDLNGSGGQIEIDNNSTFLNNAIDIRFAPYNKLSTSTIENSHFLGGHLRDSRYAATSTLPFNIFYAPPNISQRAVYGIRQWQNFIVEINGNDFYDYEEALFLTDSRLRIIGNEFSNCRIGINTNSTMSVLIYGGQVEGNTFKNVRTHINASGGRYLSISDGNNFNSLSPIGSQSSNLFGIYLNHERAFNIFDNIFTSLKYGIVAINSNTSGGAIRYQDPLKAGNHFTDCWRSIHLQGNNVNLTIKCNSYNNTSSSSSIYNTNWYLISGGTLANQGWPSLTDQTSQAGNWFTQSPLRNQLSSYSNNQFTYFRHGAGSPDEVVPSASGTGVINIDANSTAMTDFTDACDPTPFPTNGEPDRLAHFENILDSLHLEMDTLLASLDNQLTDSLLNIIDDTYALDTIVERLRSNEPLSDTGLIKAIQTTTAMDDHALFEILYTNSPLSAGVIEVLNARDPALDDGLRSDLNAVQGINPPISLLPP
ncbi:MAG: hypothetical protein IPP71_00475 [Bacteroidetes bacterium]|nr:hypothetical protein [Bacteroidota bacterium]